MRYSLCRINVLQKFFEQLSKYSCRIDFNIINKSYSNKIMKVLNVAEKNDAAKNIANLLSRGTSQRREGLSPYNKIYEFDAQVWNQRCRMTMTSVSGHLMGFDFLGPYRSWHGCSPLELFDAPLAKSCSQESYIKIKKTLEREILKCDALIIWTDCDREGENIGFEIIQVCKAVKPNIQIHRAKFSEITSISVNRALQTLTQPNEAISNAVDVRSELDLRIGAAFTRFQTLRLQKVFPERLKDLLISYGSCQFPTLGFVVERFLAIENFKSEPYWKIRVMDERNGLNVEFRWKRGKLFEKTPCQVYLDICLERGEATVIKVTSKPKSKWRPLPLDTVELEKLGSRKLKLSAKETMKIAEKLYSQGLISYPRTETNIFPKELNLVPLVSQQTTDPRWGTFAETVLQDGVCPRQGKKSDQAHPPIHPIKYSNDLQGNEAKVYEFVVRHFLACISKNAEGQETIVEIDVAEEIFITNGLEILAKNYLDVYIYEKWNAKEIHKYRDGDVFKPTKIEMVEENTSPPKLLTEADLIALMDKHGIGTDATHAEHIDTIKSRQYVGLQNDGFYPGKLGIGLVMGYDSMGFQMSKPYLRAELESDLKLICDGQKQPQEILKKQIDLYRDVFKTTLERANLIDNALAKYLEEQPDSSQAPNTSNIQTIINILKCPKCGFDMILRNKKQGPGFYIGCTAFPNCRNAIWLPQTVENIEVLDETCNSCLGNPRKLRFKLTRSAFPIFGTTYVTCIGGCDPEFNEVLDIQISSVQNTIPNRNNIRNDTTQSNGIPNRSNRQTNTSQSTNSRNNNQTNSVSHNNNNQNWREIHPAFDSDDHRGRNNGRGPTRNVNNSKFFENSNNDSAILCNCHEEAILLTVRKEGPNQGRLFYKCPNGKCDYFLWAENNAESSSSMNQGSSINSSNNWRSQNPGASSWNHSNGNSSNELRNQNDQILCACQQPARRLLVQKEGPNKGRYFYGCPKGPSSTCKFFQWADDPPSNDSGFDSNFSGNFSSERGARTQGKGQATKKPRTTGGKRKCGICGVEGHTRKTCPQNSMD